MLDVRTLFFVMIVISLVLAFSLWMGVGNRFRAGLNKWVASLLLQCVVFSLFAMRGRIGDMWTVIIPNGLFLVCISLKADALMEFYGRKFSIAWHVVPPLILMAFFTLLLNQVGPRVVIGSTVYAAGQMGLAMLAHHLRTPATQQATRLLIIGYVIGATAFMGRAIAATLAPQEMHDLLGASMLQSISFLIGLTVILIVSLAFLLLYKEKAEDEAQRQAVTDPLTNVLNRRMFLELGEKELARSRRTGSPLSLVMIDIDHFKRINDKFGHAAGDAVLQRFVDVTSICLRREDLLVRYGGEEFCVLLPEVSAAAADIMAERVRYAVEHAVFQHGQQRIPVTISIGVATLDNGAEETLEQLVQHADEAMYAAKNGGRNRVVAYPQNTVLAILMKTRAE